MEFWEDTKFAHGGGCRDWEKRYAEGQRARRTQRGGSLERERRGRRRGSRKTPSVCFAATSPGGPGEEKDLVGGGFCGRGAGGAALGAVGGGVWDVDEEVAALGADVVAAGTEFAVEEWAESDVEDEVVAPGDEEWEEDDPKHDGVDRRVWNDLVEELGGRAHEDCPCDHGGHVEDHVERIFEPCRRCGSEDQSFVAFGDCELGIGEDGGEVGHGAGV